jgi:protein-arginine deiminase
MSNGDPQPFRLEVDADRDGVVEPGEPGRWDWQWQAGGLGAIALPDLHQTGDEPELTPIRLSVPDGSLATIGVCRYAAPFVTVYRRANREQLEPILGVVGDRVLRVAGPLPGSQELWLRPLQMPDSGFRGLVELTAHQQRQTADGPVATGDVDRAVVRVSPWIMTPNTCEPVRVYAVRIPEGNVGANAQFMAELADACAAAGVEFREIDTRSLPNHALAPFDRWIQDEIEFGYVAAPGRSVPVVVDGPRNRGLDTVGTSGQLGEGIGALLLDADFNVTSSLDAFGNVEVSPPATVGDSVYPLGRIVFGTKRPGDDTGRKASLRLREFLYEQFVQTPFEVYTDWLAVGHIDEAISFVPADSGARFRVLVASPQAARELFERLARNDLGTATLWRGQRLVDGSSAEETVEELLGKEELWAFNRVCQEHMATVAEQLRAELGLGDDELVPIPVAFEDAGDGHAGAYFPDMVNHLVLGNVSVVPRPYGPLNADGVDELEEAFRTAVPDRDVRFVDDWLSYHKMSGEVHCGTNVLRGPIPGVNWWEHRYEGVHNSAFPGP